MDSVATIILRQPWETEPRLKELALHKRGLLEVRDIARHEASNATAFHAATRPGPIPITAEHGRYAIDLSAVIGLSIGQTAWKPFEMRN